MLHPKMHHLPQEEAIFKNRYGVRCRNLNFSRFVVKNKENGMGPHPHFNIIGSPKNRVSCIQDFELIVAPNLSKMVGEHEKQKKR